MKESEAEQGLTLVELIDLNTRDKLFNFLNNLATGSRVRKRERERELTEDFECCSESVFQI